MRWLNQDNLEPRPVRKVAKPLKVALGGKKFYRGIHGRKVLVTRKISDNLYRVESIKTGDQFLVLGDFLGDFLGDYETF